VLVVSLNKPVWVRAYVPEPSLGKVHLGMAVKVHTDSRPGKPYSGTVGFISPVAEFTPKNVETEALRTDLVYRRRIVVDDPDQGIRQGMPVTITAEASALAGKEAAPAKAAAPAPAKEAAPVKESAAPVKSTATAKTSTAAKGAAPAKEAAPAKAAASAKEAGR